MTPLRDVPCFMAMDRKFMESLCVTFCILLMKIGRDDIIQLKIITLINGNNLCGNSAIFDL